MDALLEAITPALVAALNLIIPAAALAVVGWLRARALRHAAEAAAVHAAAQPHQTPEERLKLAEEHAADHSAWARMTTSRKALRRTIERVGPDAVRRSNPPPELSFPPGGDGFKMADATRAASRASRAGFKLQDVKDAVERLERANHPHPDGYHFGPEESRRIREATEEPAPSPAGVSDTPPDKPRDPAA